MKFVLPLYPTAVWVSPAPLLHQVDERPEWELIIEKTLYFCIGSGLLLVFGDLNSGHNIWGLLWDLQKPLWLPSVVSQGANHQVTFYFAQAVLVCLSGCWSSFCEAYIGSRWMHWRITGWGDWEMSQLPCGWVGRPFGEDWILLVPMERLSRLQLQSHYSVVSFLDLCMAIYLVCHCVLVSYCVCSSVLVVWLP